MKRTSAITFGKVDRVWIDDAGMAHTAYPQDSSPRVHGINRFSPRRGNIEGLGGCGCGCDGMPGGCGGGIAGYEENKQTLIGMGVMGALVLVSLGVVYFTLQNE